MGRPAAFYYEDYDTKSDPEYLYHKEEADREFHRLEAKLATAESLVRELARALQETRDQAVLAGEEDTPLFGIPDAALSKIPKELRDER
jgi:hypothetical protein